MSPPTIETPLFLDERTAFALYKHIIRKFSPSEEQRRSYTITPRDKERLLEFASLLQAAFTEEAFPKSKYLTRKHAHQARQVRIQQHLAPLAKREPPPRNPLGFRRQEDFEKMVRGRPKSQ